MLGELYIDEHQEGPSTQYFRLWSHKKIKGMVFGNRVLEYWGLGPSWNTFGSPAHVIGVVSNLTRHSFVAHIYVLYVHAYFYTHVCINIYSYIHIYICVYVHTCAPACTHTHIWKRVVYMCIYDVHHLLDCSALPSSLAATIPKRPNMLKVVGTSTIF